MTNKALSIFIILLVAAVVVWVGQSEVLRARAGLEKNDARETPSFSVLFSTLLSFGQSLLSFVFWLPQLVKKAFWRFFFLLTSSVTRTTTSTTTATTSPIGTTSMLMTSASPLTGGPTSMTSTEPATAGSTSIISTSASAITSSMPPTSTSTSSSSSSSLGTSTTTTTTTATAMSTTTTTTSSTTTSSTSASSTTTIHPQKIVFLTNTTSSANLGGVEGADDICQLEAENANLAGTFLAWISNTSVSPFSRFVRSTVPYVLTNGTVIAMGYDGIMAGPLLNPIGVDANGNSLPTSQVWTATNPDGAGIPGVSCNEWRDSFTGTGVYGSSGRVDRQWSVENSGSCSDERRLYCFKQ